MLCAGHGKDSISLICLLGRALHLPGAGPERTQGEGEAEPSLEAVLDEVSRPPQPASVEAWHVVTVGETALLRCS